jgi:hypothetical protein
VHELPSHSLVVFFLVAYFGSLMLFTWQLSAWSRPIDGEVTPWITRYVSSLITCTDSVLLVACGGSILGWGLDSSPARHGRLRAQQCCRHDESIAPLL